jgi:predicted PhzF superfamily epimerase YddE/YHI9/ribosomal protein S18 acetylase RimI-like enzyme
VLSTVDRLPDYLSWYLSPPTTPASAMSEKPLSWGDIRFREVRPTDIPAVAQIEKASYPEDEAASKSALQYRQHHAAPYFRCAVVGGQDDDNDVVIGYICSTRCREFEHESMSLHIPNGSLLAIHSVVVQQKYRKRGIATAMLKEYVEDVQKNNDGTIEKMVLLAKKDLLAFYVECGFQVKQLSSIVHGSEQWYDLELDLENAARKPGRPYYVVDAFADTFRPGSGNPAAIVIVEPHQENEQTSKWMQTVAKEFNLSETAFLWPAAEAQDGKNENKRHFHIRYFTPTVEIPLCGHATLASASVLYHTVQLKNRNETSIVFHARKEIVNAELAITSTNDTRITMEFPVKPAVEVTDADGEDQVAIEHMMSTALRVQPDSVIFMGVSEIGDLLVEITHDSFRQIPYEGLNYPAFKSWDGYSRGVIVCCSAPPSDINSGEDDSQSDEVEQPVDFLSRFFAPKAGINEDPVTGSAHCVLAPYFAQKFGKENVVGNQVSERGGVVFCTVHNTRVKLTGSAVTTMTGVLFL